MEDIKKLVGNRIRELRKEKGLSQEELGYRSELHYTHIGAMERGEKNWSIETLIKAANGLEVSINDLLKIPSKRQDIMKLRDSVIKNVNRCSPETLTILSDLFRILEKRPAVRKK